MDADIFVSKILQLDERDLPCDDHGFVEESKIPAEIIAAADNILITPKGNPNYGIIVNVMEPAGIKVYAGEQDSFGWLSGVIETPKGQKVVVF